MSDIHTKIADAVHAIRQEFTRVAPALPDKVALLAMVAELKALIDSLPGEVAAAVTTVEAGTKAAEPNALGAQTSVASALGNLAAFTHNLSAGGKAALRHVITELQGLVSSDGEPAKPAETTGSAPAPGAATGTEPAAQVQAPGGGQQPAPQNLA